jgi:hypothetical protein
MKAGRNQPAVLEIEHAADPPDVQDSPARYVQVGDFRQRMRVHLQRDGAFVLGSCYRARAVIVPTPSRYGMGKRERARWRKELVGQVNALLREWLNG